jgi:predicted PurR-regulated permease PerM
MEEISYLIEDFIYDIPTIFLWIAFFLTTIVAIILSYILNYHWKFLDTKLVKKGRGLYFTVLVILLLVAIFSVISFQISK